MGEFTLKVPAAHAEDFRRALVKEMEIDIRSVNTNEESLKEALYKDRLTGEQHADTAREDVGDSRRLLHRDAALMAQADLTARGGFEISTGDIETLFHACESMAREIVGPQLNDALGCSPIDGRYYREDVRPLIERLTWALERAAEVDAEWQEQHKEEVA